MMEHITKLIVSLRFDTETVIEVGELMKLAQYFKINNAAAIIESVQSVVRNWPYYASACGVGRRSKNEIKRVIGR